MLPRLTHRDGAYRPQLPSVPALDEDELGGGRRREGDRHTPAHQLLAGGGAVRGRAAVLKPETVVAAGGEPLEPEAMHGLPGRGSAKRIQHATPEFPGVVLDAVPMHAVRALR